MWKNNKGFTTVELIIAVAIAGMLMGAVGSFMAFNIGGFQSTKDVIDIQYEGQVAMNQMTRIFRESTGIIDIQADVAGSLQSIKDTSTTANPPEYIEVQRVVYEAGSTNEEITEYKITYDDSDADNIKLICNYETYDPAVVPFSSETGTYTLLEHIGSISIEPSAGINYEDCEGILINLELVQDDAKFAFQSEVKFRNKNHTP